MKTKSLVIAALAGCLLLAGCEKSAQSVERSSNNEIDVDLLFEKDGIRVYRFTDNGRFIYYTDARGRTEWTTSHSNGKSTTTRKHSVETVE